MCAQTDSTPRLFVGWTTTETREQAVSLARALVDSRSVACAQISGPITSVYRWNNAVQEDEEWRLTLKFLAAVEPDVRTILEASHPYDVPQWVCVPAESASRPYADWVREQTD